MTYKTADAGKLKTKFWLELAESPLLFLQQDANPDSAVPMRVHLDRQAQSAVWFFVAKDHHFMRMGTATATFASKGHDIFARFTGILKEEPSLERRKKHWDNHVEAWFPQGLNSDEIAMLRMDLGRAEIWDHNLGLMAVAKMAMGMDVRDKSSDKHVETTL